MLVGLDGRVATPRTIVAAWLGLSFEWHAAKAARNLRKHGVSFTEAITAFGDEKSLTAPDLEHSEEEERDLLLGRTSVGRLVVVCFTDRGERLRIISASKANQSQQETYEEGEESKST